MQQNSVKKATSIDTSKLAKKIDLVSLKSEVIKLDIDKLETIPTNSSKLSNSLKNDVVKELHIMNWLQNY